MCLGLCSSKPFGFRPCPPRRATSPVSLTNLVSGPVGRRVGGYSRRNLRQTGCARPTLRLLLHRSAFFVLWWLSRPRWLFFCCVLPLDVFNKSDSDRTMSDEANAGGDSDAATRPTLALPASRVKRVMQADDDIGNVAKPTSAGMRA